MLVAGYTNNGNGDDQRVATQPLEALQVLVGMAVVEGLGYVNGMEKAVI